MKCISFWNPGEIDPRLITTMGCNVKPESENPIGFFGTGLKYAIAVLMREGQRIIIHSGLERFEFGVAKETLRGKTFQFIQMNGESIGFTTELGKNWSLRSAYRELYCNALDEGGDGGEELSLPAPGRTLIQVFGDDFYEIHLARGEFILSASRKRKLFELPGVGEIWEGPGQEVFYKGIAVGKHLGGNAKFTYNIQASLKLSEDRAYAEDGHTRRWLAMMLGACPDKTILRTSLIKKEGPEQYFYFDYHECTEQFYEVVRELIPHHKREMNESALEKFYKVKGKPRAQRRAMAFTPEETEMLDRALEFWLRINVKIKDFPVNYVHHIDSGASDTKVLALAEDGQIWITPECFESQRLLELAIFEEWVHLTHGVNDETRAMQNVLFDYIRNLTARTR